MLINQPLFNFTEHLIELSYGFVVTSDQLLFNKCKFIWKVFKDFSFLISFRNLCIYHFFSWEETLVLFNKMMSCMICNALNTNIFLISLAKEFKWLIMIRTEFIIFPQLFLFTSKLKSDIIFCKISRFDLRTVFVPTSGAIEHFLFIINNEQTLFANGMTTIKIPGYFLLRVIKIVAHWTLHYE